MGYKRKKQMKKIKSNMAEESWNFNEGVVNSCGSDVAVGCLLPIPNSNSNQFNAFIAEQNQYEMNSASALVVPSTSTSRLPFAMSPMEQLTFQSVHKKIDTLLSFDNIQNNRQIHHQYDPYTANCQEVGPHSSTSLPNVSYNNHELVRIFPSPSSNRELILAAVSNSNTCCNSTIAKPNHSNKLAPIGVFWDIENMHIPKGKSGLVAVQVIREQFFAEYQEAEFVCVCDIKKESNVVIQELNDAQVNVLHVSGNSKNAADDKLRQSMRRFADVYSQMDYSGAANPPTIILISGDINFSTDLMDFRYRKRLQVILLHNKHAPDALLSCANKHFDFYEVLGDLPARPAGQADEESQVVPLKGGHTHIDLIVSKLPSSKPMIKVKSRLKKLSDNSGGRVVSIQGNYAVIRFPNKESAQRATKRMNGEDVFGAKIIVTYSSQMNMLEFDENQDEPASSNIPDNISANNEIVSKTRKSSPNATSGSGTESDGAVIYNGKKYVPKELISKSVPRSPPVLNNSSPTPSTSSSQHSKIVDSVVASAQEKLENLEIQNQQQQKLSAPTPCGDQKKKHKQKLLLPVSLSTPASPARTNEIKFFKLNSTSCTENPCDDTDEKKNLIDYWNSQFKPSNVFNYFANRSSSSPFFTSNNNDDPIEPNNESSSASATEASIQSAYSHLWRK